MKTLYGTTAVALALGFGVAVASAPASAAGNLAGDIVIAQAGGGGAAGPGSGASGAGTGGSGESGAQHPMERSAAEPVGSLQCDADDDGFVDADEARACYRQRFGTISGGVGSMTEEQFSESMTEVEDAPGAFAEIDADGDGEVSEAEWEAWHDQSFTESTQGSEGRMRVDDYGAWEMGGRAAR